MTSDKITIQTPEALLTSQDVADLLQVTAGAVNKWVEAGRLHAFRTPGGHRRIQAGEVYAFVKRQGLPVPEPLRGLGARRLLIVDDDQALVRALTRSLGARFRDRIEIQSADNGVDGLVKIGAWQPHVVLLDVYMPGMDGIEVCRQLHQNHATRELRVVVASGNLDPDIVRRGLEAGARHVLPKPIDLELVGVELGLDDRAVASQGASR